MRSKAGPTGEAAQVWAEGEGCTFQPDAVRAGSALGPWSVQLRKDSENGHRLRPQSFWRWLQPPRPGVTEAAEKSLTAKGLMGPPVSPTDRGKPNPDLQPSLSPWEHDLPSFALSLHFFWASWVQSPKLSFAFKKVESGKGRIDFLQMTCLYFSFGMKMGIPIYFISLRPGPCSQMSQKACLSWSPPRHQGGFCLRVPFYFSHCSPGVIQRAKTGGSATIKGAQHVQVNLVFWRLIFSHQEAVLGLITGCRREHCASLTPCYKWLRQSSTSKPLCSEEAEKREILLPRQGNESVVSPDRHPSPWKRCQQLLHKLQWAHVFSRPSADPGLQGQGLGWRRELRRDCVLPKRGRFGKKISSYSQNGENNFRFHVD